jgi:hypothetical protein
MQNIYKLHTISYDDYEIRVVSVGYCTRKKHFDESACVEGTDSSTGKTIKVGPTEPIFASELRN